MEFARGQGFVGGNHIPDGVGGSHTFYRHNLGAVGAQREACAIDFHTEPIHSLKLRLIVGANQPEAIRDNFSTIRGIDTKIPPPPNF